MTAAFAVSRSGSRRIDLAALRFALRWGFFFMTAASNATSQSCRRGAVWSELRVAWSISQLPRTPLMANFQIADHPDPFLVESSAMSSATLHVSVHKGRTRARLGRTGPIRATVFTQDAPY